MNQITFPGFGLNFKIDGIAFTIGNINIYWYAVIMVSAFLIGILFCKKDDGKYNTKFEDILDILLIVIPISIICARLYYVLFNLKFFIQNPIDIFNIRNGGLAIYGGIIGGIAAIIIICKLKKIQILNVLDYLAPYLALRTSNW